MSKTFLKVSLSDIEFFPDTKLDKNDIVCIVFLNGNCVDKLYFKYKDYQSNLPLANIIEKVQLIFQAKDTGELIGSISFPSDIFIPFRGKAFAQWFTLFDSTEDDEFDGYIGEHDEEYPRVLISFRVESPPGSMSQLNTTSPTLQFIEPEKDHYLLGPGTNRSDKQNSIYGVDEQEARGDASSDSRMNLRKGDGLSLTYNGTSISHVKGTKGYEDKRKQQGTNEGGSQNQNEEEINVGNLDGKIGDLLSMLQNQEKAETSSRKKDETSLNLNDFEENRELLELEMKKCAMLEETLKSVEVQLSKHEKLYEELEMKSQAQYKQLLEKNKTLNEENYNLKQKIGTLEDESDRKKVDYTSQIEKISQEWQNQATLDKATIEKHEMNIENLERLNNDLGSQLEHAKASLNHEKELNKQLQKQLEENLTSNKGNITGLKDKLQGYFDQIQAISDEKSDLEVKNSNAELKIQALEVKSTALEAQYESSRKELEKVLQEIQEYKDLTNSLKQSMESATSKKDEEIMMAREAAGNLEEHIRRLKSQNEFMTAEKNELTEELLNLKQMGYEGRINNLETALASSEEARKNLQAQLQKSETRMQVFVQQQKEKSLVAKVYEDTIQEIREKNKNLMENIENLTNQMDQMKYESTELKLKLDEHGEISEQNLRLKEKLESSKDENYKLKNAIVTLRQQLFNTSTELIRQTNTALEQGNIIKQLTQQMQALDNSLRIAFGDIKRMHFTLEAARKSERVYEPYIPRYNDEMDQKMSEFCNRAELPIKFIRMKPGVYGFGSRKVRIEHKDGKLFVQAGDEKIPIEEFVRLYAQNELFKMRRAGEDTQTTETKTLGLVNADNTEQLESGVNIESWNSSSFSPTKGGEKKRVRKDRSSRQSKPLEARENLSAGYQRNARKVEEIEEVATKSEEVETS